MEPCLTGTCGVCWVCRSNKESEYQAMEHLNNGPCGEPDCGVCVTDGTCSRCEMCAVIHPNTLAILRAKAELLGLLDSRSYGDPSAGRTSEETKASLLAGDEAIHRQRRFIKQLEQLEGTRNSRPNGP